MSATQQNLLAIASVVIGAVVMMVTVGALSSRTLREEGVRRLVKRWLGH